MAQNKERELNKYKLTVKRWEEKFEKAPGEDPLKEEREENLKKLKKAQSEAMERVKKREKEEARRWVQRHNQLQKSLERFFQAKRASPPSPSSVRESPVRSQDISVIVRNEGNETEEVCLVYGSTPVLPKIASVDKLDEKLKKHLEKQREVERKKLERLREIREKNALHGKKVERKSRLAREEEEEEKRMKLERVVEKVRSWSKKKLEGRRTLEEGEEGRRAKWKENMARVRKEEEEKKKEAEAKEGRKEESLLEMKVSGWLRVESERRSTEGVLGEEVSEENGADREVGEREASLPEENGRTHHQVKPEEHRDRALPRRAHPHEGARPSRHLRHQDPKHCRLCLALFETTRIPDSQMN